MDEVFQVSTTGTKFEILEMESSFIQSKVYESIEGWGGNIDQPSTIIKDQDDGYDKEWRYLWRKWWIWQGMKI